MGGFFMMLLKLFILRLSPLVCLKFCKKRNRIKLAVILFLVLYGGIFMVAAWNILQQEQWKVFFYLPLSMFPHYLFYGFVIWILMRCIWSAWSDRVWKRIYKVSFVLTILGILTENYWNSIILEKILKNF